jgi:glycosyltransferase involved in cell wall biosynthesis
VNILLVHNFYQQAGGEDQVFADEASLLESNGHHVERFTVHNASVEKMGRVEVARKTIWNSDAAATLAEAVRRTSANIVHFHNTFPLISPAAYQAVRKAGAAVVQTLHNYRLMCPSATLFRDGGICEDCVGKTVPWPAVVHACYRNNRPASAAVAAMLTVHRARGTFRDDVDAYIALTEFSRQKFVQAGLPADRIIVKPNFLQIDPGIGSGQGAPEGSGAGGYAVFVGRLAQEKGIRFLLRAWGEIGKKLPLKILGDGPLRADVEAAAAIDPSIQYLGRKPLPEIYDIVGEAAALVFPSLWYEGLPRTIIEALAKGTPVLASNLGSMAELVTPGVNGLLFEPGDEVDLEEKVAALTAQPAAMRAGARKTFEDRYTAERNYPALMSVYEAALNRSSRATQPTAANSRQAAPAARPLAAGSHRAA